LALPGWKSRSGTTKNKKRDSKGNQKKTPPYTVNFRLKLQFKGVGAKGTEVLRQGLTEKGRDEMYRMAR